MGVGKITIKDIEPLAPFSQGSTEIFLTGYWSSKKPFWSEKVSPCRNACPIGNDISRAFYYASKGEYDRALEIIREENPLPGICGRVCYHPCEDFCNRKDFDQAINIRGFERFIADHGRVNIDKERPTRIRDENVAIIGSGPAGLSAAYHLTRLGYKITIFEALPEPGGMLRYGIPAYRLPRDIIEREIAYIKALGVKIKTNFRIGKEIKFSDIKKDYQAVFVAIGAHKGMKLNIESEDTQGVMEGVELLKGVNSGVKIKIGRKVIVIGGGNTAIDCARTALRLGAKEVIVLYRRTRSEMPALSEDIKSALAEGIRIEFLVSPNKIISSEGKIKGVECIRMELGAPDESGRPKPIPIKDSNFIISTDNLIIATGQMPDSEFLTEAGITTTKRGIIKVSLDSLSTEIEGVFAGGDSAGVKAFVADAIASGKRAAMAISCYIEGKNIEEELAKYSIDNGSSISLRHYREGNENVTDIKTMVNSDKINKLCFYHEKRVESPLNTEHEHSLKSFDEITGTLSPKIMKVEIDRCFKCGTCTGCDLCFHLCPDISILKKDNEGYEVRFDYCKGCGVCASVCPRNIVDIRTGGKK